MPGPPQEVTVEALSDTELKIKWLPPHQEVPVEKYHINITLVKELSDLQELESGMVKNYLLNFLHIFCYLRAFLSIFFFIFVYFIQGVT